jgi:hypothetical protein
LIIVIVAVLWRKAQHFFMPVSPLQILSALITHFIKMVLWISTDVSIFGL